MPVAGGFWILAFANLQTSLLASLSFKCLAGWRSTGCWLWLLALAAGVGIGIGIDGS